MSVHLLPPELLDAVARHLPPSDLAALAAVGARFAHVAHRLLYRHVVLDSRSVPCVFTLASNPHLARHVRSFELRLSPQSTLLAAFYRRLARALSNMSELTSLVLAVDHAASWILRTPDHSTYRRLRRFSSSFHLDHHLAHFLSKTDALVELQIDPAHDSIAPLAPLHHRALMLLNQFTGSSDAAQLVVPGRPVEHIHLNSGDLTEDLAESLARSTAPITGLLATTTSHSVSLIGTLTRCMEHLVHLRLVTTYNFSDAPDATYFSNISDALTSLPDLQSCEIWGIHWISSKKGFQEPARVWESEAFNNIPANNLLTNGQFLDDLYSDFSYAY